MTLSQIDLFGGETPLDPPATTPQPAPGPRPLTARQDAALQYIQAGGPLGRSSDDLGAFLHQARRQEGGRGHDADTRCDWCGTEGKAMGKSLRKRDLVWQRDRMWTATEHRLSTASPAPATSVPVNEFPEGF